RQSSRRTAQQLALHVWAFRLEARPEDESVLLPLLLSGAAGLELAESGGGESHAGRDALLVQARRGRIPPGRRGHSFRGSEAYGQSGPAGHGQVWAAEHGGEVRQETAGSTRRDAQIAQCGGRVWFRADRGNVVLQRFGAEGVLRRTQRRTASADGADVDGVKRPRRGTRADAMERKPERRVQQGQAVAAGSGELQGTQRRERNERLKFRAQLLPAIACAAPQGTRAARRRFPVAE